MVTESCGVSGLELGGKPLVVGVCCSFADKDAGSPNHHHGVEIPRRLLALRPRHVVIAYTTI
jgi:hypothetical protein